MGETERGCGWRKMGGVYLVCDGAGMPCDALPVEMSPCECCDFTVNQARSMQPIHAGYLAALMKGHNCRDEFPCPLCWYGVGYQKLKADVARIKADLAKKWDQQTVEERAAVPEKVGLLKDLEGKLHKPFYLMFVSKDFYSPESFVKEAMVQGISKRVAPNSLPKGFVVGKDWVFLAHGEVPFYPKAKDAKDGSPVDLVEPYHATGIFYAFKPERLEVILWKGTDAAVIADYEEAGYTVILLEKTKENVERHGNGAPPPLPYGFKRKDKTPIPELPKGSNHRGLSESAKSHGGKPKTTKTKTESKTKKKAEPDDAEESDPSGQWKKGEL